MTDTRPLIVHIVFRFDYGGLENGVVNLVNGSLNGPFRHAIIALTVATEFAERVAEAVPVYELRKRPGKDPAAYVRLFRLLRGLAPWAVHTRNIGTLDCALVAFLARVPVRVHGEHGWDIFDPDGARWKYQLLRRRLAPFVRVFVTVSDELRRWLTSAVGIRHDRVVRICNGVDTERFLPLDVGDSTHLPREICSDGAIIIGSVTRFSAIKDPLNLVEAFLRLRAQNGTAARRLRLVMIGDGELRAHALERLEQAGASAVAWLPGSRDDIPRLLRNMDIFVSSSLREGISNTILEAMASGLPVVATAVGGSVELVVQGETGTLIPPSDADALAAAIASYVEDRDMRVRHGRNGRERAVAGFSIATMLRGYGDLYSGLLQERDALTVRV